MKFNRNSKPMYAGGGNLRGSIFKGNPPPFMDMSSPDYTGIPPININIPTLSASTPPPFFKKGGLVASVEEKIKRKFQK